MTTNATRSTKKSNGAPNYYGLYMQGQEDLAELRQKHAALQDTFKAGLVDMDKLTRENAVSEAREAARKAESKSLHKQIDALGYKIIVRNDMIEQLDVEAYRSVNNFKEMKYYKKSARLWCVCSTLLLVGILSLPVWL